MLNNKNIFLCIPTLSNAGAERFVTELACNINRVLFNPIVLITRRLNKNSNFYEKLINNEIIVLDASSSNIVKTIFKINKYINLYKPCIIHTNIGAVLHLLIPIFLSNYKIIHLFTVHSMAYRIFKGVKKQILQILFKRRKIIPVAICETVKKSIMESYNLNIDKIECVYNGVDTNIFVPMKKKNNDEIIFINVGTLYEIKNHELLIEAFSIVHKKNKLTKLVIVGDGVLRQYLEEKINRFGLNDSVILYGQQNDVKHYLVNSHIYCCSSKVEGLPISVLEAMACGLPIITTKAGGVVDIVKDNINGFITKSSADDIAEKMLMLTNNKKLYEEMCKKSRQISLTYDIKKCALGYEEIYAKYLKNNK